MIEIMVTLADLHNKWGQGVDQRTNCQDVFSKQHMPGSCQGEINNICVIGFSEWTS